MTEDLINETVFNELAQDTGSDFVLELVSTFLEEAPDMIAELKSALADGDADGFRRAAHSIKSNANVFGASGLSELARKMEIEGSGAVEISTLEDMFAKTAGVLRSRLDD